MNIQQKLTAEAARENPAFLSTQLITYIGSKRALLPLIEAGILHAREKLGGRRISFLDLFSGTGVVARMARQHAREIHCNDLELYSHVTNLCYQHRIGPSLMCEIAQESQRLTRFIEANAASGLIASLYAPQDDANIQPGERAFYTRRNAIFLDTFQQGLSETPEALRPFLLAPMLAQASVHTNTSGVFKGFYKNRDGVGQFGGAGRHALARITREIKIKLPVTSRFDCEVHLHRQDANALIHELAAVDVAYFDPPYNQHPYGSNYFMLNLLCDYREPQAVSKISGIPKGWNRSAYNRQAEAGAALFSAVAQVKARFVLLSYNSEGFVPHEAFIENLSQLGELSVMDTKYNTFRGCRNLSGRSTHVTEYLYLLDKG